MDEKRKENYENAVQKALNTMVTLIVQETVENGICPIEMATLKAAAKTTQFAYNEALGRLKAMGFISERKHFNKNQLMQRTDDKKYYYQVDLSCHPDQLPESVKAERLAIRRRNRDRINAYERKITAMVFSGLFDMEDE